MVKVDDYTIVIPTLNRHYLFEQSFDHYSQFQTSNIIYVDSSPTKYRKTIPNSITYIHTPHIPFIQKVTNVLVELKTSYIILASDDDFLIEKPLEETINELIDSGLPVAVGENIFFKTDFDGFYHPKFSSNLDMITKHCSIQFNPLWSIYKREFITSIFNLFSLTQANQTKIAFAKIALVPLIILKAMEQGGIYSAPRSFYIKHSKKHKPFILYFLNWLKDFRDAHSYYRTAIKPIIQEVENLYKGRGFKKLAFKYFVKHYFLERFSPDRVHFKKLDETPLLKYVKEKILRSSIPFNYIPTSTEPSLAVIIDHGRIPLIYNILDVVSKTKNIVVIIKHIKLDEFSYPHHTPLNRLYSLNNTKIVSMPSRLSNFFSAFKTYMYGISIFEYKPILRLFMMTKMTSISQILFERDLTKQILFEEKIYTNLINRYNVKATLMISDKNISFNQPGLWLAAKKLQLPIIIPHLFYHGPYIKEIEKNRKYRLWIFASLYQRYVFTKIRSLYPNHSYKEIFYYQAYVLNTLHKLGIGSTNPWIIGTGPATDILCDSRHTAERYIKWGTKKEKIAITGEESFDALYESNKNAKVDPKYLHKKYHFDKSSKLLILAVPQLFEHKILDEKRHFKEIDFLVSTLTHSSYVVILSLHPKMDREKYSHYPKQYHCQIADEPLKDILPYANLFVATFSNTILWAAMLRIPSIVVDFYGFHYSIYDFLASVQVVTDKTVLKKVVDTIDISNHRFEKDAESLSTDLVFHGNVKNTIAAIIIKKCT